MIYEVIIKLFIIHGRDMTLATVNVKGTWTRDETERRSGDVYGETDVLKGTKLEIVENPSKIFYVNHHHFTDLRPPTHPSLGSRR